MTVQLPIDLLQLPMFRKLRDALTGQVQRPKERAAFLWFALYQELAYAAASGGAPGRLESMAGLAETVQEDGEVLAGILKSVELIVKDEQGWLCPRFLKDFTGGGIASMARSGGHFRAFNSKMKAVPDRAVKLGTMFQEDKMVDAEGNPLDGDQRKKVLMLIMGCDTALGLGERQPYAYAEGLIQNALVVLKRFTDEQINEAFKTIVRKRDNPMLAGVNTEKLLVDFGGYVES